MPVPPVIQMYRYVMGSGGGVSNLLQGSEQLGSTGVGRWNQDNMNAVNSDQVNNPAGTEQTADQLDFKADKSAKIRQDVTLVAGTEYTFSVWARAASGTQDFRLSYWDVVGRNFGTSAHTASATWSPTTGRYSFTFTAATSGTFNMFIQNAADGATRRVYFWGAMLNVGATAADYIKTEFIGPSSPATPPMEFGDNFAGVTAYYSLRRFTRGAEDQNAIRVRRSSDDTEQDIGFDANGDLDTTALLAFVGTGGTDNGFVTTFYDQSGNGNNATNATASEQPLVVSGGTLVEENSKAAIEFSGNPVYLDASSAIADAFTGNSVYYKFEVAQVTSTSKGGILCANTGYRSFFNPPSYDYANFHNPNGLEVISSLNVDRTNQFLFSESFDANTGGGTYELYGNGSLERSQGSEGTSNLDTPTSVYVGRDPSGGSSGYLVGKIQEIIFLNSDQSSNRTTMETNINDHFSIYP